MLSLSELYAIALGLVARAIVWETVLDKPSITEIVPEIELAVYISPLLELYVIPLGPIPT